MWKARCTAFRSSGAGRWEIRSAPLSRLKPDDTEQSVREEAVVAGDPAADFPAVLTKDVPGG